MTGRAFQTILPPNATFMEKALEETISRSTDLDIAISSLWNINTMPKALKPALLPYLAWSLGVEVWSSDMTVAQKEETIKNYLVIRALRGTRAAIEKAYEALGVEVEIVENPPSKRYPMGEPHKFKLKISAQPISRELRGEISRLTDLLKPLKAKYFIDVDIEFEKKMGIFITGRVTGVARFLAEVTSA